MAPTLAELKQRVQESNTGVEDIKAAIQASRPPVRSGGWEEAVAQGLIGGIPLLVGAMAGDGKQGIYGGAQGGLLGLRSFEDELDRQRKADELAAAQISKIYFDKVEKDQDRAYNAEFAEAKIEATENAKLRRKRVEDKEGLNRGGGSLMERSLGQEGASKYFNLQVENLENQIEQRNQLPQDAEKTLRGSRARIFGLGELSKAVSNNQIAPEELGKLQDEFRKVMSQKLSSGQGEEEFRPYGIISDVLARSKIDQNSPTAQAFRMMLEVGRDNAVAQTGVASNQDVAQEVYRISISPLEKVETYLERLNRLTAKEKKHIATTLEEQKAQKRSAAYAWEELYKNLGLVDGGENKNEMPAPPPPVGAVTKRTNRSTGEVQYLDAQGNVMREYGR